MKKPIQQVRGAVLVMAALVMVLLIGVAALALDMGRLYVLHTEMQNAVDAAVLSAAVELDGEAGALDMAKAAANQEMLNHLAHFSKQDALLENLQAEDSVFTFYSWIGSDMDSSTPPSDCAPVDGKCVTTSDDDASYVQIELDPVLLATDDDRYEIDLYFLPVLSLFGVDTATEASTRVVALAGSHTEVCNYPPMFICDPSEGGDPLVPGQMVALKEQGPGAPWVAGTFGWLIADEVSA
ncbi:MAG: Tad domain-containing protein, partial [Gammaproteobacteria bacterium]|nr:Tad domain-containing protein [Gammaproteobacteria bacterium]